MRRLIFIIGLILFMIPSVSAQENIAAPIWKTGEKWTFRYDSGGEWTVKIIGEENGLFVDSTTRSKGKMRGVYTRYYDKNSLNCVKVIKDGKENNRERDYLKKYFDFPLYIGKNWSYRYTVLSSSSQKFINILSEFSAVQFDDIEVPAGKFKAIKIKNKTSIVGTNVRGIFYYWWSPDVKAPLKVEYEPSNFWKNQDYKKFELISFELK